MGLHRATTDVHRLESWVYANAGARTGATGFVSADVGRIAYQTDTGAYYRLTATAPTWVFIGGPAGSGGELLTANNLSDVANAGTSRTNLGLGTAATHAATDFLLSAAHQQIDAHYGAWVTDTDGATVTFDLSASNLHRVTLGGDRTLALSNDAGGQAFLIRLKQDGTGSRTVTWFSGISWAGGTTPTLTTTANKADLFSFIRTGTNIYDGLIVGQNL